MTLAQIQNFGDGGLESPPRDWVPITPNDSTDLDYVARAIMNRNTTTAVTVVVRTYGGGATSRTVVIPAGHVLPGLFTRVLSTGTDVGATLSGAV